MEPPRSAGRTTRLDRRTLLALACAGCGLAACGAPGSVQGDAREADAAPDDVPPVVDPCSGEDAGALADFPVGTALRVDAVSAIVAHDAGGLWAVDATCPHFGGRIVPRADGTLQCTNTEGGGAASHGAVYSGDGTNLVAEAMLPAKPSYNRPNYAVGICAGRVRVDRGRIVSPGTRTPIA